MADRVWLEENQRLGSSRHHPTTSWRKHLVRGRVLLCLAGLAAGCGPKGYIEGIAYHPNGEPLSEVELLVGVGSKTHVVITGRDGTFRISGIALGSRLIRISFYNSGTGERYHWEASVQVGIQGARITVKFSGTWEGFQESIQAVWRELASGEWESAKKNLEAAAAYAPEGDDGLTCSLAWGWYYLRSGENSQLAKEYFEKAYAAGRAAEAGVGLAAAAAAAGVYSKAVTHLEQALAVEPDLELDYLQLTNGDLQVALAGYYLQSGDDVNAVQILEHAVHGASPKGRAVQEQLLLFLAG
jgi:hypothetical protein